MSLPTPTGWLVTFFLHSTLLALLALLALRITSRPELRVVVLRGALLGGWLTATLATAFPGNLALSSSPLATPSPSTAGQGTLAFIPRPVIHLASAPGADPSGGADLRDLGVEPGEAEPAAHRLGSPLAAHWPALLSLALLLFGLASGLALLRRELRGRRRLAARRPLDGTHPEQLLARLTELLGDSLPPGGVLFSHCEGLTVPLALGRREIVLPSRALGELPAAQLETLLAHEVAHLVRRDPLWLGAARIVAALTRFQPLQGRLLARLEAQTEHAADDWAVAATGRPLDLLRSLERVATWLSAGRDASPKPATSVAMARGDTPLLERAQRILSEKPGPVSTRRVTGITLAVLAVGACGGPVADGSSPTGPGRSAAGGEASDRGEMGTLALSEPYTGADAQPGEMRFIVQLDAEGRVVNAPGAGAQDPAAASIQIGKEILTRMHYEADPTIGVELGQDRVTLLADPQTPFQAAKRWLTRAASKDWRVWKVEVGLSTESPPQVVPVFLPTGHILPRGRSLDPTEQPPEPVLVRVALRDGHATFARGPKLFVSAEEAARDALDLHQRIGNGEPILIDVRESITFGQMLPFLRELVTGGVAVSFVGEDFIGGPFGGRGRGR